MTIQLKIQIRGIKKPPVWRRIVIPGNFSFHGLHDTIQAAFGWWGEHLYQFQRHPFDGGWTVKEPDEENDMWGDEPEDSHQTNVGAFIQHMGTNTCIWEVCCGKFLWIESQRLVIGGLRIPLTLHP